MAFLETLCTGWLVGSLGRPPEEGVRRGCDSCISSTCSHPTSKQGSNTGSGPNAPNALDFQPWAQIHWPESSAFIFPSQHLHNMSMMTSISPFPSFPRLHPPLPVQRGSALAGSSLVTAGQSWIADSRGDFVNYSRAHHGFLAHLI